MAAAPSRAGAASTLALPVRALVLQRSAGRRAHGRGPSPAIWRSPFSPSERRLCWRTLRRLQLQGRAPSARRRCALRGAGCRIPPPLRLASLAQTLRLTRPARQAVGGGHRGAAWAPSVLPTAAEDLVWAKPLPGASSISAAAVASMKLAALRSAYHVLFGQVRAAAPPALPTKSV